MGAASLHPGEARVGPGAHSGGVRPRFSLRSQRRAILHAGVAWPKPSDSGEGIATSPPGEARIGPGAHSGGGPTQVQPARPKACRTAWALQGRGRATQERVQPLPTGRSLDRAGSLLGWGPAQIQPSWPKARQAARASHGQAARASPGRSQAAQERVQLLLTGRSPDWAGSPLWWRPAQIQPSWQKA